MPESLYQSEFRDKASLQFEEAYSWYEEKREGLGEEFASEVDIKLSKIVNGPYHYKKISPTLHEAVIDRFPFVILFNVKEKQKKIVIAAIFHTSRNPKKKYR